MAAFQFPVDDLLLLLLLLVSVPRVSRAIRSPALGCTECSVVFEAGARWKFSRILHPQCFSCALAGENCQKAKPNIFYGFPQALPPHLVEKLQHTIMGGSAEASRHYYSRFSRLFFSLWIQSIKEEHV